MSDYLESAIFLAEAVAIYAACYFLARWICTFLTKYNPSQKRLLRLIITNAICFTFFIVSGLLDNYYDVRNATLEALRIILTPLSFFWLICFSIGFFILPLKNSGKDRS